MALSQGISEALINTAFGILTGALAVISYNYYTNKIDKLTYSLDEVGFSIVQTFAATHKQIGRTLLKYYNYGQSENKKEKYVHRHDGDE